MIFALGFENHVNRRKIYAQNRNYHPSRIFRRIPPDSDNADCSQNYTNRVKPGRNSLPQNLQAARNSQFGMLLLLLLKCPPRDLMITIPKPHKLANGQPREALRISLDPLNGLLLPKSLKCQIIRRIGVKIFPCRQDFMALTCRLGSPSHEKPR